MVHDKFGGNLEKIVCGGAPIRDELGKFFEDIGIELIGGYGITECSPLVINPDSFNDYRTAGCRLACVDWKIENPSEEGIGEILVKGDIVMMGYYKMPEETTKALRNGWFYTGDYGYITKKDQLVITGRKANIIVLSNGKNIYPEELENEIMSIQEVQEVIVSGTKDEKGNVKFLMAEVFLSEEHPLKHDELLQKIHIVLEDQPSYKRISHLVIREEEFPKTTSKKIKR